MKHTEYKHSLFSWRLAKRELKVHRHPVVALVPLEEDLIVVLIGKRALICYLVIKCWSVVCLDTKLFTVVAANGHPSVVKKAAESGLRKVKRLSTKSLQAHLLGFISKSHVIELLLLEARKMKHLVCHLRWCSTYLTAQSTNLVIEHVYIGR